MTRQKFEKPSGVIVKSNRAHPVIGGWMTKEESDLSWANLHTPSKNPKAVTLKLEKWRKDKILLDAEDEQAEKDHNSLRDWLITEAKENMKTNVIPAPTSTVFKYQDFYMQCYLLSLLPELCIKPEEKSYEDWAKDDLGLDSINDVYPVITQDGMLRALEDLIFDFGYGPNYFNWRQRKPFMLKGVSATLYLISIDIGLLAGEQSLEIWKIGITKGQVTGESPRKARYSGEIAGCIKILREKRYADARDAFMIEQTMISCSKRDTILDIDIGPEPLNPKVPRKSASFELFKDFPRRIQNTLGYSEWIYSTKNKTEVVEVFDRLTAYPEFHGSGQTAYSLFNV